MGEKIDACDIVMRTNSSRYTGFEKYVGSRTDYVLVRFSGAKDFNIESEDTKIICIGGGIKKALREQKFKNSISFWKNAHRIMKRTYGVDFSVSSGVIAICYWLNQKICPIYVVGVDGFVLSKEYNGKRHRTGHDKAEEQYWLKCAVEKGWIEYL